MAKELTGCGKFLVWVVPTLVAATAGYFLVGPRIGGIGLGDKVPVIRSLGQELARKVKGEDAGGAKGRDANRTPTPDDEGGTNVGGSSEGATPPPANDGATEFQRVREAERARRPARNRRAPVDVVD